MIEDRKFKLVSPFQPTGDQPEAIAKITEGLKDGLSEQTILGVTGSGKTFTMASIIANMNCPALILAHNKTLAAQLCSEFKEFFPENAVEFFVSYYDYYQPEAYIPSSDTYIEKDADINQEIDRLRHSATAALFERRDVIIVASVSCIYGLGDPEDYTDLMISLRPGMTKDITELAIRLTEIQYTRNDFEIKRGTFRIHGDTMEVMTSDTDKVITRIEFFGDEIEKISEIDAATGKTIGILSHCAIFPASHYATTSEKMKNALSGIEEEMNEQVRWFKENDKIVEAYRLEQRTRLDLEMLNETGFCSGIENYSRHISGRAPGTPPYTLLDYFPDDFIMFIDESHVTVPQVRAMYNGDRARKKSLVDFGFRLPSAYDNRPLTFEEFQNRISRVVYVSATPGEYERSRSAQIAEQIIRPTGLLDPKVIIRPVTGQIDDLTEEIRKTTERNERVLITTLTKRMAENLTEFFHGIGIKVKYLHSDIKTIERTEILRDLRMGEFDVLIGINLLREGLDLPEVSLVAILDADKEGFIRSETSLIQTIGRAARNANGRVIMYADEMTDAIKNAVAETNRRRSIQDAYNKSHGIVPKTIRKSIREVIDSTYIKGDKSNQADLPFVSEADSALDVEDLIEKLRIEMNEAAADLRYEDAAVLRDRIKQLKKLL